MPVAPIPCRFKDVIFKYVPEHAFEGLYREHKIAYVLAGTETDDSGTKWLPCLVRVAEQETVEKEFCCFWCRKQGSSGCRQYDRATKEFKCADCTSGRVMASALPNLPCKGIPNNLCRKQGADCWQPR